MFDLLAEFEAGIEDPLDAAATDYYHALVVMDKGDNSKMPVTMKLDRTMKSKVFQLISLYKLVDMLHIVGQQAVVSGRNPKYSRMEAIGVLGSNKICCASLLSSLQAQWQSAPPQATITGTSSSPAMEAILAQLFQDLNILSKKQCGTKILFNVQMAAIHLFFILQGHQADPILVYSRAFWHLSNLSSLRHCPIFPAAQMICMY